jgi:hypothetical protein
VWKRCGTLTKCNSLQKNRYDLRMKGIMDRNLKRKKKRRAKKNKHGKNK